MVSCTNCGTDSPAGRRFCDNCGASLASACPNCGEPNRPEARFCGNCATPLAGAARARAVFERTGARRYLGWLERAMVSTAAPRTSDVSADVSTPAAG